MLENRFDQALITEQAIKDGTVDEEELRKQNAPELAALDLARDTQEGEIVNKGLSTNLIDPIKLGINDGRSAEKSLMNTLALSSPTGFNEVVQGFESINRYMNAIDQGEEPHRNDVSFAHRHARDIGEFFGLLENQDGGFTVPEIVEGILNGKIDRDLMNAKRKLAFGQQLTDEESLALSERGWLENKVDGRILEFGDNAALNVLKDPVRFATNAVGLTNRSIAKSTLLVAAALNPVVNPTLSGGAETVIPNILKAAVADGAIDASFEAINMLFEDEDLTAEQRAKILTERFAIGSAFIPGLFAGGKAGQLAISYGGRQGRQLMKKMFLSREAKTVAQSGIDEARRYSMHIQDKMPWNRLPEPKPTTQVMQMEPPVSILRVADESKDIIHAPYTADAFRSAEADEALERAVADEIIVNGHTTPDIDKIDNVNAAAPGERQVLQQSGDDVIELTDEVADEIPFEQREFLTPDALAKRQQRNANNAWEIYRAMEEYQPARRGFFKKIRDNFNLAMLDKQGNLKREINRLPTTRLVKFDKNGKVIRDLRQEATDRIILSNHYSGPASIAHNDLHQRVYKGLNSEEKFMVDAWMINHRRLGVTKAREAKRAKEISRINTEFADQPKLRDKALKELDNTPGFQKMLNPDLGKGRRLTMEIMEDFDKRGLEELEKLNVQQDVVNLSTSSGSVQINLGKNYNDDTLQEIATAYDVSLDEIKNSIEPQTFNMAEDIRRRGDEYFGKFESILDEMEEAELIDEPLKNILKEEDYISSRFLRNVDPELTNNSVLKSRGSGIQAIDHGSFRALETDGERLAIDYFNRSYKRIFENKVFVRMRDIAETDPSNGLIYRKLDDIPNELRDSFEPIPGMTQGKPDEIFIPRHLAGEYKPSSASHKKLVMDVLGWLTLTRPLKYMTTGPGNPSFGVWNVALDVPHASFVNPAYSKHAPHALAQISGDMAEVTRDVAAKTGLWREAKKHGLDFGALHAQERIARTGTTRKSNMLSKMFKGSAKQVEDVLNFPNRFSEEWVRVAAVNRGLKRGWSMEHSVAMAVDQLDYGQKGWVGEMLDSFIPYFNPGVQVARKEFGALIDNPAGAWLPAVSWAIGLGGMAYAANRYMNKDAADSIRPRDNATGVNIVTPWSRVRDFDGDMRHLYYKLPLSGPLMSFYNAGRISMRYALDGEIPDEDEWFETIKQPFEGFRLTGLPPAMSAYIAMAGDYDSFMMKRIFGNRSFRPIEASSEYVPGRTTLFYKKVGDMLGLPPERTRVASEKIFGYRNPITQGVAGIYEKVAPHMSQEDKDYLDNYLVMNQLELDEENPLIPKGTDLQINSRIPVVNRLVRVGPKVAPTGQPMTMRDEQLKLNTQDYVDRNEFDQRLNLVLAKEREPDHLLNWIDKQPGFKQKNYLNRLNDSLKYRDYPNPSWWMSLRNMSPEARAEKYVHTLINSKGENREFLIEHLKDVPGAEHFEYVNGEKSYRFLDAFNHYLIQYGEQQRENR